MSKKLFMKRYEKIALEIYLLLRDRSGIFSSIAGSLGRNDPSRISRQLNPSDDRRDNPYTEFLEIQATLATLAPDLEEKVWNILERERERFRACLPTGKLQLAELVKRAHSELGDVNFAICTNASMDDLERETFEAMQAATATHERVKQMREEKQNFIN